MNAISRPIKLIEYGMLRLAFKQKINLNSALNPLCKLPSYDMTKSGYLSKSIQCKTLRINP